MGSLIGPLVGGALVSQDVLPNQLFQISSIAPLLACVFLLIFAGFSTRRSAGVTTTGDTAPHAQAKLGA